MSGVLLARWQDSVFVGLNPGDKSCNLHVDCLEYLVRHIEKLDRAADIAVVVLGTPMPDVCADE